MRHRNVKSSQPPREFKSRVSGDRPRRLEVALLRTDGETQARTKLDEAVVADYADAWTRGDKLPPITVFHDGKDYWLADGFHRVASAKRAGRTEITAHVLAGKKSEAAWYALGANRTNGLRMGSADKERAIKRAMQLKPGASNRVIADHVGVDHHTVSKYRAELESRGEIPQVNTRTGADGKEYPAAPQPKDPPPVSDEMPSSADDDPPPANDENSAPITAPAEPPTAASEDAPPAVELPPAPAAAEPPQSDIGAPAGPGPEAAASPILTDKLGMPFPNDKIAEAFRRDHELVALCTAVSRIKTTVLAAIEQNDPLYGDVLTGAFTADVNNLRNWISSARPYAVCPFCGGDGCRSCRDRGWVNEATYKIAPRDLKQEQRLRNPTA